MKGIVSKRIFTGLSIHISKYRTFEQVKNIYEYFCLFFSDGIDSFRKNILTECVIN